MFNALFLEKKVITTNKDIVNYDFYSKNNIYIYIPGEEIDFSSSFFQTKFTKIDNFDCYSLHSWLKKIIDSCN